MTCTSGALAAMSAFMTFSSICRFTSITASSYQPAPQPLRLVQRCVHHVSDRGELLQLTARTEVAQVHTQMVDRTGRVWLAEQCHVRLATRDASDLPVGLLAEQVQHPSAYHARRAQYQYVLLLSRHDRRSTQRNESEERERVGERMQ